MWPVKIMILVSLACIAMFIACGKDEVDEEAMIVEISTDSISFGTKIENSTFDILNSGNTIIDWDIRENLDWLETTTVSGTVKPGKVGKVTLAVDRGELHKLMDKGWVEIRATSPNIPSETKRISVSISADVSDSFYPLIDDASWAYMPEKSILIIESVGEDISLHMSPVERRTEPSGSITTAWSAWCMIDGSKVSYDYRYQLAFLEQDDGLYCSSEELELDITFEEELGTLRTTAVGTFDPPFKVFPDF